MDDEEDVIPEMKMDVMGLDYSVIMARVRYLSTSIFYCCGEFVQYLIKIYYSVHSYYKYI